MGAGGAKTSWSPLQSEVKSMRRVNLGSRSVVESALTK